MKNKLKSATHYIIPIAIGFIVAVLVRKFIFLNCVIPSESMENTLNVGDNIFGSKLAYKNENPKRGDIIIFHFPDDPSQLFVKRVIGLPGETVEIKNAKVYINGNQLEEDYLKENWTRDNDGYSFAVPEGSYFVMGDNRNNSLDSRYWNQPFVDYKAIEGKAVFRYFPFNKMGKL